MPVSSVQHFYKRRLGECDEDQFAPERVEGQLAEDQQMRGALLRSSEVGSENT